VDGIGERCARINAFGLDLLKRLGQELVVTAVGSVDRVSLGPRQDGSDGSAFLADARVRRSVDEPVLVWVIAFARAVQKLRV
jgi:hypothetical protein